MEAPESTSLARRVFGGLLLAIGVSVFLVRFQHAGPYQLPQGGNLAGGLLSLLLGAWFVRPWLAGNSLAKPLGWLAIAVSPIALYMGLYGTLAELEEVVVLFAKDRAGQTAKLRLWIVDRPDGAWVSMKRAKADAHGLTETRAELLRAGETRCVIATRDESRARAQEVFSARDEKYAVQRFAQKIGAFPSAPGEDSVTLRLTPCPDA